MVTTCMVITGENEVGDFVEDDPPLPGGRGEGQFPLAPGCPGSTSAVAREGDRWVRGAGTVSLGVEPLACFGGEGCHFCLGDQLGRLGGPLGAALGGVQLALL